MRASETVTSSVFIVPAVEKEKIGRRYKSLSSAGEFLLFLVAGSVNPDVENTNFS